jgi:hypothetical protein
MASPVLASRDSASWAEPVAKLTVADIPKGAVGYNLQGRQVVGPLQGFGQMWQKTYRVHLPGVALTPAEIMKIWKEEFPVFQPAESCFYPSMSGIQPGSIIFINLELPVFYGLRSFLPMESGVIVLYADDEMFTVMTPEGFPVSGWNTFGVYEEDGTTVAQVQSIDRATDPIYEFGTMFLGGAVRQEENWMHVLTALAARSGIHGQVQVCKALVDPRRQWLEAKNVLKNAVLWTFFYRLTAPMRAARNFVKRQN